MNKSSFKIIFEWILCSILVVCLVYFFHGDSITLLPLDIKYFFADNLPSLYMIVYLEVFLSLVNIYALCNYNKLVQFRWHVRIGAKWFVVGTCKIFYKYANALICATTISILLVLILQWGGEEKISISNSPLQGWESYSTIAHAMGIIDDTDYTNSLEAFERNYELGNRVFEVDFRTTIDDKLVAVHDWNQGYQEGIDSEHVPTEECFTSTLILGKYTPLTLENILILMKDYEDIYIVTDTKSRNIEKEKKIFEEIYRIAINTGTTEVLDRIIVQIYNDEMLETVREIYDFPSIIYTLYLDWDGEIENFVHYCRFCKNNNIKNITMWNYFATPEILSIANDFNINIYVHTVNDKKEAQELMNHGVKGVYTDTLNPDSIKEDNNK